MSEVDKNVPERAVNNSSGLCRMPVDHVCWERCDPSADEHYHPPPEKIWLRFNSESRFGVGAVWSPTPESDFNIEYALVSPTREAAVKELIDAIKNMARQRGLCSALTLAELSHLSSLLRAEQDSGYYAGSREQYYARTERLIKWVGQQIKAIAKAEVQREKSRR